MDLGDYLRSDCIFTNVKATNKWDVLERIVKQFDEAGALAEQPVDADAVLEALRVREKAQSTGLGDGIAIPHARIPGFTGMAMGLMTLQDPVDFEALDGKPVKLIWTILVAEDEPTLALQAYAKIQELMQDDAIRVYFETIEDPNLIRDYISQRRIPVGGTLTARDIMRPPSTHIFPDMPLRDVVHEMRRNRIEAVPVEDDERRVIGEITCDRLFQYGIPDFFNQLQNVAFISRFDPFEKYFSEEANATACDVMQPNFATVPPDATMLEVVFALTVERHTKVYVVSEGQRIGTIDRIEVLDRILDF